MSIVMGLNLDRAQIATELRMSSIGREIEEAVMARP
jgi:hypothetical protein